MDGELICILFKANSCFLNSAYVRLAGPLWANRTGSGIISSENNAKTQQKNNCFIAVTATWFQFSFRCSLAP